MPDPAGGPASLRRRRLSWRGGGGHAEGVLYPRWLWPSFAAPGMLWLAVLFLVPFYVVFAVAFGSVDPIFRDPVPAWNPLDWDTSQFQYVFNHIFGDDGFFGPPMLRTLLYVGSASVICLVIAYPVAYFVARFGGRRRGLLLALLIAPFWVSYMMRMLAWVNLLEDDGWVNRALKSMGLIQSPVNWLAGKPTTVILGLVYGYVPYMILPLFAALDRIDQNLIEAARDLGASRFDTFRRVILPMSKQAILAGVLLVSLPMFGDYFTNDLLSGSPRTSMFGNLINEAIGSPGQVSEGAALVVILLVLLIPFMVYYAVSTGRAARQGA